MSSDHVCELPSGLMDASPALLVLHEKDPRTECLSAYDTADDHRWLPAARPRLRENSLRDERSYVSEFGNRSSSLFSADRAAQDGAQLHVRASIGNDAA